MHIFVKFITYDIDAEKKDIFKKARERCDGIYGDDAPWTTHEFHAHRESINWIGSYENLADFEPTFKFSSSFSCLFHGARTEEVERSLSVLDFEVGSDGDKRHRSGIDVDIKEYETEIRRHIEVVWEKYEMCETENRRTFNFWHRSSKNTERQRRQQEVRTLVEVAVQITEEFEVEEPKWSKDVLESTKDFPKPEAMGLPG